MTATAEPGLRYLGGAVVARALSHLDPCVVVRDALLAHAAGSTSLPAEAYLGWTTSSGAAARSLAMPGALGVGPSDASATTPAAGRLGIKVINASLDNPDRGLARAQGLVLLFDPDTGRITTLLEAAQISATRTAAASLLAVEVLAAAPADTLAVLGAGALARAHLQLARRRLPTVRNIRLMDVDSDRSSQLAAELRSATGARVTVTDDPVACVAGADVVLTCTTSTQGYLPASAFAPGATVVHVSLDDVLPDVVDGAHLVAVDDWDLVAADHRRLLGRMLADGRLTRPAPDAPTGRLTTIGAVLRGVHPGRSRADGVVLVNPFGMAVLDIALASAVNAVTGDDPAVVHLPR